MEVTRCDALDCQSGCQFERGHSGGFAQQSVGYVQRRRIGGFKPCTLPANPRTTYCRAFKTNPADARSNCKRD